MHSEAAWSIIDPKPVNIYLKELDAHIVYWNGYGTTRSHALMIVGNIWNNVWASPLMKVKAWNEFNRIYRSNGFKTRSWDTIVDGLTADGYYAFTSMSISKNDRNFFTRLKDKYDPKTVLGWFHRDREIVR